MNSTHRFEWIDAVKGFAILLVMWGHVQQVSPLRIWIASYHVPIFLFCTGFLYAALGRKKLDVRKVRDKLLYPYLTFSVIAIVAQLLYMFALYGYMQAIKTTVMNLYKTLCGFGIDAIWFIPSYFIAVVSFFWLLGKKREVTIVSMLLLATLGVLTEFFLTGLKEAVGSTVYNIVSYPVVAIVRGLVCCIFIGGGVLLVSPFKENTTKISSKKVDIFRVRWPLYSNQYCSC